MISFKRFLRENEEGLRVKGNITKEKFKSSFVKMNLKIDYIDGDFSCSNNQLTTLEGAPREVGGNFYCYNNKVKFTEEQVRSVCNVKGKIYV